MLKGKDTRQQLEVIQIFNASKGGYIVKYKISISVFLACNSSFFPQCDLKGKLLKTDYKPVNEHIMYKNVICGNNNIRRDRTV